MLLRVYPCVEKNGKLQKWVIKASDKSARQIVFDPKPSSGHFRVKSEKLRRPNKK